MPAYPSGVSMSPRIVVLGAGVGGLVVADELKAKVKDKASVTLVDRKGSFHFPPSFPWVALGTRTPAQVQRELAPVKRRGIEWLQDEVTSLDLSSRTVRTRQRTLPYDHLIIALGASYAPESIPGFSAHAYHMYDLDSAVRLREAVASFTGGTVAVGVARLPFKCPAAPYEMAFLLDDAFRRKGIREKVRIEFFTPEGAPIPAAGPENGGKVVTMLEQRAISYQPKHRLREVAPGSLVFDDETRQSFDLLVCVPPHVAPKPVIDAGLTDASGWVPVDSDTLQTKQPGVFAVGDVAAISTPNGYVPFLPKAGVFAHGQAEIVAHNLAVEILGTGRVSRWDGYGACFLEVARGKSAFMSGHFLAAPRPTLELRPPRSIYHTQKVLFERYWLGHWF